MQDNHLVQAAKELTKAMNRVADETLPGKLAGIVKLHAALAVGSAFIPVPVADMAAAAANIWTMYVRINKELGLPFGENLIKSVAAGVVTNLGGAVAGVVVVGSVLKVIPAIGSFGGAVVMGTTIYAITITSGIVYMKAVAKLLTKKSVTQVSEADLTSATSELIGDRQQIKEILKAAKREYRATQKDGAVENESAVPPASLASPLIPAMPLPPTAPAPPEITHAISRTAFLATDGKTYGPYPTDEVQRMWTSRRLSPGTHFWMEGMDAWMPIERFPFTHAEDGATQ